MSRRTTWVADRATFQIETMGRVFFATPARGQGYDVRDTHGARLAQVDSPEAAKAWVAGRYEVRSCEPIDAPEEDRL